MGGTFTCGHSQDGTVSVIELVPKFASIKVTDTYATSTSCDNSDIHLTPEDHAATTYTCHYIVHVSCGLSCDNSDTDLTPI